MREPAFDTARRFATRWLLVGVASSLAFPSFVAAQEVDHERRASGTVRAGAEYDDNVFRKEGEEQEGGFLSRYFAAVDLATRALPRSVASASLSHGGKFFFLDEHGNRADTLLTQFDLSYRQRLLEEFGVWATADLRDRTEREPKRDYTTGSAGAGLETTGRVSARAGTAVRFFAFKPSSDSSSTNVEGLTRVSLKLHDEVAVYVGYTVARRNFQTDRLEQEGDELPVAVVGELRRDTFHFGQLGVGYQGLVVADLRYSYAQNVSNSIDLGFRRHAIELTATAPLPWRLFASVHFELQRAAYEATGGENQSFFIDEDNRNAAVLSLARALGENWEVETRYSLYLQEFGVESKYRRMTISLALGYLFD